MSRSTVFGPNSLLSFTKFGALDLSPANKVGRQLKERFRLENQRYMQTDVERERRYRLCMRCGSTTVTVNFDRVPSARLGLWGRCVNQQDYTHHRFVDLSQREYEHIRNWPVEKRLNWWRFEHSILE